MLRFLEVSEWVPSFSGYEEKVLGLAGAKKQTIDI